MMLHAARVCNVVLKCGLQLLELFLCLGVQVLAPALLDAGDCGNIVKRLVGKNLLIVLSKPDAVLLHLCVLNRRSHLACLKRNLAVSLIVSRAAVAELLVAAIWFTCVLHSCYCLTRSSICPALGPQHPA